jgi:hypothetical protein
MKNSMGRTKTLAESGSIDDVPDPVDELDKTREIPAVSEESALPTTATAAPQQVIPIEETVPVQSCIERTLLQEVLRQQSAENDEDQKTEEDD